MNGGITGIPVDDQKFIAIMDKISEVSERTARIEERQKIQGEDLAKVKEQDEIQNKLLAEHIAGVRATNERLNVEIQERKDVSARVSKLEELPNFFKSGKAILVYIAIIVGIVYEAGQILGKW